MKDEKPEKPEAEFVTIPNEMPGNKDALDELEQAVRERYAEIRAEAGSEPTQAQVEEMEKLAEALDRIEAKRGELEEEAEAEAEAAVELAARAAAVASRFTADDAEEPADEAAEEFAEDEGEEPAEEPAEEPEDDKAEDDNADDDAEDDNAEDDAEDNNNDEGEAPDEEEKEYSMSKTKFGGTAKGAIAGEPAKPKEGLFSLDRAVPNYTSEKVDLFRTAEAFESVASGRALVSTGDGTQVSAQFAHIKREMPDDLVVTDERSANDVLDYAVNESRLPGSSLTAAAGWCAPSTTVYEFLETDEPGNLYSLPEISVARGGIRFPVEPDMSPLYDLDAHLWTEADAIAGNKTKQCVEIPCAEMEEVRLDAMWTCVTSNLLANKGWPELTAKVLREATRGHLHRISAYRLRKVVAGSTAVSFDAATSIGAAGAILNALALQAQDMRAKHRLSDSRTIEAVAPVWMQEVIRADLALRQSVAIDDIPDSRIVAWFAQRGIAIQFVSDWQNETIGSASTPAVAYPEAVEVLMYPAGTWWSAVEPVINLGVTYDSTGLAKNQRTELFIEDGLAVGKRGFESRKITIPMNVNGQVGLRAPLGGPVASGE